MRRQNPSPRNRNSFTKQRLARARASDKHRDESTFRSSRPKFRRKKGRVFFFLARAKRGFPGGPFGRGVIRAKDAADDEPPRSGFLEPDKGRFPRSIIAGNRRGRFHGQFAAALFLRAPAKVAGPLCHPSLIEKKKKLVLRVSRTPSKQMYCPRRERRWFFRAAYDVDVAKYIAPR